MWGRKANQIRILNKQLSESASREAQFIRIVRDLTSLANGCKKHPAYRAVRKPTADCDICIAMTYVRERLSDSQLAELYGYKAPSVKRKKSTKE